MKKKYVILCVSIISVLIIGIIAFLAGRHICKSMENTRAVEDHVSLAEEYMAQEKYEDAVAQYCQAWELDTENTDIQDSLIDACSRLSDYYSNLEDYEKAYDILKEVSDATGNQKIEQTCEWIKQCMERQAVEKEKAEAESAEAAIEKAAQEAAVKYNNYDLSLYLTDYFKCNHSDYDVEQIDYSVILSYVYAYDFFNQCNAVESRGTDEWISKSFVDDIAEKTYGVVVPEQDIGDVSYVEEGFLYQARGLPGSWGKEYVIVESVSEENNIYQISFADAWYMAAEGKTAEELDAIYHYTGEQVRENKEFEVRGEGSCVLKYDGANLLMQKLTYIPLDYEDAVIGATELVEREVPELEDLYRKVFELSSQQAGIAVWEEEQQLYDTSGTMHDCTLVNIAEDWQERVQTLYIFAVDKDSQQVFWYDQENDVLTGTDAWREAAAYWFQ